MKTFLFLSSLHKGTSCKNTNIGYRPMSGASHLITVLVNGSNVFPRFDLYCHREITVMIDHVLYNICTAL